MTAQPAARRSSFAPSNPAFTNGPMVTAFQGNRGGGGFSNLPAPSAYQPDAIPTAPDRMTLNGTILKSFGLLGLLLIGAMTTWSMVDTTTGAGASTAQPFLFGGMIVGLIAAIVTVFKPTIARITAPIYAVAEGLFVGGISALYATAYDGIVGMAAMLTVGITAAMLALYTNRIIRVTPKLRKAVMAATLGVMAAYVLTWIGSFFGANLFFIHDTGPIGILVSLVIIGIASFNLLLDFDFIENGVKNGAPKWAEWYAAFGLLVTIVWLYLELLRLLSKLQRD